MSEINNNIASTSLEQMFEARAKQVLSSEPILSARDVEVQLPFAARSSTPSAAALWTCMTAKPSPS